MHTATDVGRHRFHIRLTRLCSSDDDVADLNVAFAIGIGGEQGNPSLTCFETDERNHSFTALEHLAKLWMFDRQTSYGPRGLYIGRFMQIDFQAFADDWSTCC